jgi:hypothetical protein
MTSAQQDDGPTFLPIQEPGATDVPAGSARRGRRMSAQ